MQKECIHNPSLQLLEHSLAGQHIATNLNKANALYSRKATISCVLSKELSSVWQVTVVRAPSTL